MRVASDLPHPYLLNGAGGVCRVKEFALTGDCLTIVPAEDEPFTGTYHLIYRCPEHPHSDIKRAVISDGVSWRLAEPLPPGDEICYPAISQELETVPSSSLQDRN